MTTDNRAIWHEAVQIHKLIDARRDHSFKGTPPAKISLEDYAGRYENHVWTNESVVLPWNGGLVMLGLPANDPADSLSFLKPIAPDRFRMIASDGSEMNEVTFNRDAAGRVLNYEEHFTRAQRVTMVRAITLN